MADNKIDGFYSEYDIRTDKATTSLEKLSKEEKELQKALKGGRKETQARTKATTDRGKAEEKERKAAEKRRKDEQREEVNRAKAFEKERKTKETAAKTAAKKAGDTVSGAAGLVGAAAGGSAIGAVASVLPLGLGAIIVGAVAAINKAANAIETVASQSKERARAGRAGLGLNIQGKGFGAGFSPDDIRGAKTVLGELGVERLNQREIDTLQEMGKVFGSLTDAASNIVSGKNMRPFGQEGKNAESILGAIPDTPQTGAFKAQVGFDLAAQLLRQKRGRAAAMAEESAFSLRVNSMSGRLAEAQFGRDTGLVNIGGIEDTINAERNVEDIFVRNAVKGSVAATRGLEKLVKKSQKLSKMDLKGLGRDNVIDTAEKFGMKAEDVEKKLDAMEGAIETGDTDESPGPASVGMPTAGNAPSVTFYISGVTDPMSVYKIIEEKFSTLMNRYAGGQLAAELGLRGGSF